MRVKYTINTNLLEYRKNREFYIKCGMKYKPENQDGVYVWIKK